MKIGEPVETLEQYGKPRSVVLWLSVLEFAIAGLPIALYIGQSLSDSEALSMGLKWTLLLAVTAIVRMGCRWSFVPTVLPCAIALLPVVVVVYHTCGYGVAQTLQADGWDY